MVTAIYQNHTSLVRSAVTKTEAEKFPTDRRQDKDGNWFVYGIAMDQYKYPNQVKPCSGLFVGEPKDDVKLKVIKELEHVAPVLPETKIVELDLETYSLISRILYNPMTISPAARKKAYQQFHSSTKEKL